MRNGSRMQARRDLLRQLAPAYQQASRSQKHHIEVERADPTPENHKTVVGVDVGQRYLAVTTTTRDKTAFYSGKAVRAKADHYARVQKRLQRKGTRSAKRRLVQISGRETVEAEYQSHHCETHC